MPGHRAVPITEAGAVVDFAISHPPLQGDAGPLQAHWWQRADAGSLPVRPAIYAVHERGAEAATFICETSALRARAVVHAPARWPVREPRLA
jgi:hypothetical protein